MQAARAALSSRLDAVDHGIEQLLQRRRWRYQRDLLLADALRVIAGALRAGSSLPQALARAAEQPRAGQIGVACAGCASRISLGGDVVHEVERLAQQVGTAAARLFALVVRVQHRRGGDLSGPCHRLAWLLHERVRLDAEARAATAQARFSARAVVIIPVVLAVASCVRSPALATQLLRPAGLLLAMPGFVFIGAGVVIAHRIASGAHVERSGDHVSVGSVTRLVQRAAGEARGARASLRLVTFATALMAMIVVGGGTSRALLASGAVLLVAAAVWPWSHQLQRQRRHARIADDGIEELLEVSIALLVAGATVHEVATAAPAAICGPLHGALAGAVHRIELGWTIARAYDEVPEVAASAQLDGWLHALCASADLGAPVVDVLEQLLRDAHAARRERLRSAAQTAAPRMQLALVLLVVPGVMWLMLLATMGGLIQQLQAAGIA